MVLAFELGPAGGEAGHPTRDPDLPRFGRARPARRVPGVVAPAVPGAGRAEPPEQFDLGTAPVDEVFVEALRGVGAQEDLRLFGRVGSEGWVEHRRVLGSARHGREEIGQPRLGRDGAADRRPSRFGHEAVAVPGQDPLRPAPSPRLERGVACAVVVHRIGVLRLVERERQSLSGGGVKPLPAGAAEQSRGDVSGAPARAGVVLRDEGYAQPGLALRLDHRDDRRLLLRIGDAVDDPALLAGLERRLVGEQKGKVLAGLPAAVARLEVVAEIRVRARRSSGAAASGCAAPGRLEGGEIRRGAGRGRAAGAREAARAPPSLRAQRGRPAGWPGQADRGGERCGIVHPVAAGGPRRPASVRDRADYLRSGAPLQGVISCVRKI